MTIRIAPLDVNDDEQLHQFWTVWRDADAYERDYPVFMSEGTLATVARNPSGIYENIYLTASQDGEVRGIVALGLPLLDNLHSVNVAVAVAPEYRGRGIGSMLLDATVDLCRERGRTTLMAAVDHPVEGPSRDLDFATKRGFAVASMDMHRVLDLPVPAARLEELAASAAPYHEDYTIRLIEDVRPDDILEGYMQLQSSFMTEMPTGDLDVEDEVWTVERIRKMEERNKMTGRRECVALAISADGEAAAVTELMVNDSVPSIMQQSGTIVARPHRGHRLGLAVKVANLQAAQARFTGATAMHSWNADVNAHMIAINDQLGFRAVERASELQRVLTD